MASTEPHKRQPCQTHKPYVHTAKPKVKNALKTSALSKAPVHQQSNLTLSDWLMVVDYHDKNQPITQDAVVRHFANLREGALIFTQSSMSCHLSQKGRAEDHDQLNSNAAALSGKRARIVTRPDVEKALMLRVGHMEKKRETVTGAMLVEKQGRFEEALKVPEAERL
jgi:hypothetical protein